MTKKRYTVESSDFNTIPLPWHYLHLENAATRILGGLKLIADGE